MSGGPRTGSCSDPAGVDSPPSGEAYHGGVWPYIETLIPSIGLLFLLYVVLKHMMEGDRRERIAHARWEQEEARATAEKQQDDGTA
jgi:hypothetical protein